MGKGSVAIGVGVVLLTLLRAALVIALTLGGAWALTTYVDLPSVVDTLIWIGAAGYSLLCVIGVAIVLGALGTAASSTRRFR
jgi:hypothetical protein